MTPASTDQPSPSTNHLDEIDLFAGLSPTELQQVFTAARQRRLETGSFVYMEANLADTIYALLKHHMSCVGCAMSIFDSVEDVVRVYQLPLESFIDELKEAISRSIESI